MKRIALFGLIVPSLLTSLVGCGQNPVLEPYTPDPTPIPIGTPSSQQAGFFPDNRAYYQFVPDPQTAKNVTLQILQNASGNIEMEMDVLTDPDIIQGLEQAAGRGVSVNVILDDSSASVAVQQSTINTLRSANVNVILPHLSGMTVPYLIQHGRQLFAQEKDETSVSMTYSAPMTAAGLSGEGPALIDLNANDFGQGLTFFNGYAQGGSASGATDMQVTAGPLYTRNYYTSAIAGAKQSLEIENQEISDPAIVKQLGKMASSGVNVQIILPSGASSEQSALKTAGVSQVRLASASTVPDLMLVDGTTPLMGDVDLSSECLDHDLTTAFSPNDAGVAGDLDNFFQADWAAAQ